MRTFITLLFCLCALVPSGLQAAFNEGTGIIRGTIRTSEGKPAADVSIRIKNSNKGATTDATGRFSIRGLNAGQYELQISLIGYQEVTQTVDLQTDQTSEINIQLELTQRQLEEVIVKSGIRRYKTDNVSSSLRLTTPILETPQNIQVVTGKTLGDQQIISMSDGVLRNVSGLVRSEHWGDLYTNVTARGAQVQAFRNGFNMVNSYWGPLTEDMSFVDHIEFVKGPAGFMLANGDPAGLYNVVTKKPTGQTKGEASLTLGSFDLYRTTLDLDGKLSKDSRLLYRLNLSAQQKKSFRANEYNNRYSVAPVISYQLDDKTKVTAEYTWQHADMSDVGSFYVFTPDGYATLPRNFSSLPVGLPGTHIDDHTFLFNIQHQLSSDWKLTAQALYSNYYQNGSSMWPNAVNPNGTLIRGVGSWEAKSTMTMGQAFINGDVTTGRIRHRILAGIDIGNKQYFADWGQSHPLDSAGAEFNPANPYLGVPVTGYPKFDYSTPLEQRAAAVGGTQDQRLSGFYAQDELGFFDNKVRLTLAGRYTTVSQSYGASAQSANRFTPRIGLSISLDKQTSVYGLFDQAFVPQNGRLANGGSVKPITGNNMEVGIKRDWAGGKWNTGLTAYRILRENELTADPFSPPNTGLSIVLGQKQAQGVEFDLRGTLAKGLNLVANYAFTDSKVTKVADGVTEMKVGDAVPGFVKNTANLWLTYRLTSGALKGFGLSAGAMYLGGRHTFWDMSPDPTQTLPEYYRIDAGISYEKDNLTLNLNAFNLTDRYLYSGSYYSYLKAYYWQADPPRNLRFSIAYRF